MSMGFLVLSALAVAPFFVVLYVIDFIRSISKDPREPPTIWHPFPLIGHVFNILQIGTNPYVSKLSEKTHASMFTIDFLLARLYVTNSSDANANVQRAARTVSFRPFKKVLMRNLAGVNAHTLRLYDEGGRAEGDGSFVKEIDRFVLAGLSQGPGLDQMITRMGVAVTSSLDTVIIDDAIGLMDWVRHTVTLAVSTAMYGPKNPYFLRENRLAFWACDKYKMILTTGLPSSIFARGGLRSRDILVAAFEEFFRSNGPETGSEVTKGRYHMYTKHNISISEMARLEMSTSFGLFPNIVPTSFWTIYEIYTRPRLLEEIRTEVRNAIIVERESSDSHFTLSISHLRNCKILISTFQETQRIRSRAAGVRQVMSDTIIDVPASGRAPASSYLLKKGAFVQIPSEAIHNDLSSWGSNARTFDPYRFLGLSTEPSRSRGKLNKGSFIPFGYAPSVCPGRQFAATEIMTLVAMMVLRYDVEPVAGQWQPLESDLKEPVTLAPPKGDVGVRFKERREWKGIWHVDVGDEKSTFKLASG